MKLYHLGLLLFFLKRTCGNELRGKDSRELSPDPFVWQPYQFFDYFVGYGSLGRRDPSVTVLWRATGDGCELCWAESGGSATCSTAVAGPLGADHYQHPITGLAFDTEYEYTVTCSGTPLTGSFKTPPVEPTDSSPTSSTKVLAYGDSRSDTTKHDLIAQQMLSGDWYGALILHTGDLVNNGECIGNWDDDMMNPLYPNLRELMSNAFMNACRGNHENGIDCGAQAPWYTLYDKVFPYPFVDFTTNEPASGTDTPGALSFSGDYGNIHYTIIDQYTGSNAAYDRTSTSYGYCANDYPTCTLCSPHYEWLKQDLIGANSRDIRPFLVVVMHEPFYAVGGGHSNEIEPCVEKLFEEHRVNIVVLAGHNHYYSRAEKKNPNDRNKKTYYITTGGGGYCCYTPDLPVTDWPHVRKAVKANHYSRMDSHTFTDDGRYLCFEAFDINGQMIDFFDFGTRPDGYGHCKCETDLSCDDSHFCNGAELCDVASGECMAGNFPCAAGQVCTEGSSGGLCGCESIKNKGDCEQMSPYCRPRNGKIKCESTGTDFPTGPENTDDFCGDSLDNDFDGLIDCDDPDCSATAVCGGDGGTPSPTSAPSQAPTATPTTTPAPDPPSTPAPTPPTPSPACLGWKVQCDPDDDMCCAGYTCTRQGNKDVCK